MNKGMSVRGMFAAKPSKKQYKKVTIKVAREAPKPSAALTRVVKKIVRGEAETKNITALLENATAHNSPITAGDWTYPLPFIPQGVGENQRDGDRVRPKALIVKLHVSFPASVGGFPPIQARVHVVKHKKFTSQPQFAAHIATENLSLLDDGGGGTSPYDGTILASQYRVNTKLFTDVKTLNFTLSRDNSAPTTGSPFREYTIRIPCPKVLVYEMGATLPENFCPAMAFGYTYANGAPPDTAPTPVVWAKSFFTYTDI